MVKLINFIWATPTPSETGATPRICREMWFEQPALRFCDGPGGAQLSGLSKIFAVADCGLSVRSGVSRYVRPAEVDHLIGN